MQRAQNFERHQVDRNLFRTNRYVNRAEFDDIGP